jgi:DMSO reductase anchor subunit
MHVVTWWTKSPMVGSLEIPLVLLTVFTQMAVGALVFLLVTRFTRKEQVLSADSVTLTKQVVHISLAAIIVGTAISLTHIGHAVKVYRALFYHLSSWMGMEALFLALFSLSLLVYTVLLFKGSGPRIGLEVFASIAGLSGIVSSALIFAVLGSVPSWNNIFTVLFFILSFLLLGGSLFGVIVISKLRSNVEAVKNLAESYLKSFVTIFTPLLVAAIVITAVYLFYLGSKGPEAAATLHAMVGSIAFWLRVVVGFLAPLFLIVTLKKAINMGETVKFASYIYGIFLFLLAGELLGRVLFFSTSVMHAMQGSGTPY